MKSTSIPRALGVALAAALTVVAGCGGPPGEDAGHGGVAGTVHIDGSSTVFPISEAVAEEYRAEEPQVRVTVGISGTGGGFKKFLAGETDLNDASRPIKPTELEKAEASGIGFIELPVAYDGLSVVVHPDNDWVDYLSVEELKKIWQPGSTVETWSDVRPGFPDRPITLYGPGTDSGTFDYFTEAVVGEAQSARSDFTASEDDNVLVQGVAGDANALGFFGFAYYIENQDRIRAVAIDGGNGPVLPSHQTVADGTYAPLSRPIFIYVEADAASRPEVKSFVDFYLDHAAALAEEVGYVGLPQGVYDLARRRFETRVTGTVFTEEGSGQRPLAELFALGE